MLAPSDQITSTYNCCHYWLYNAGTSATSRTLKVKDKDAYNALANNSNQRYNRKPFYPTKKVSANEYNCSAVRFSVPTLSINAYSSFFLVITNLRSFPSTSHKR